MAEYNAVENDLLDRISSLKRSLRVATGDNEPIREIWVSPTVGRAMGIPPGTASVYDGVVVHADAEISRPGERTDG